MELDFQTLDPGRLEAPDATDAERADLIGWYQATNRGFHLPRMPEEAVRRWARSSARDGAALRGAWSRGTVPGSGPIPVATLSAWDGALNSGSGLVGMRMVSDVTVAPAHRRRGLARRLLTDDLREAARAGVPLAGLTASEGGIYRRFGFGPATFNATYEVDVTGRFAIEHPDTVGGAGRRGRCVQVEPLDAWPSVDDVFRRWHSVTRGSVSRVADHEAFLTGQISPEGHEPDHRLRGAVHLDVHDRPDGYVLYRHDGWGGDGPLTVKVLDMVALNASAHLGLWDFLAGIDLTERVVVTSHVDDPLRWALVDNRCVKQTQVEDFLWLRLLDLPAAWTSRPWYADGQAVVGVEDPLGFVDGTWRLTVRDGDVEVVEVDGDEEPPHVLLDASTLGSLHLGAVSVETLALTGRVQGERAALRTFAAMADGGDVPFCRTSF